MKKKPTRLELDRLYNTRHKSVRAIAKLLSRSETTVKRWMAEYNLPLRDKSEAQRLALLYKRSKHPTKGKRLSQETKDKISRSKKNGKAEGTGGTQGEGSNCVSDIGTLS